MYQGKWLPCTGPLLSWGGLFSCFIAPLGALELLEPPQVIQWGEPTAAWPHPQTPILCSPLSLCWMQGGFPKDGGLTLGGPAHNSLIHPGISEPRMSPSFLPPRPQGEPLARCEAPPPLSLFRPAFVLLHSYRPASWPGPVQASPLRQKAKLLNCLGPAPGEAASSPREGELSPWASASLQAAPLWWGKAAPCVDRCLGSGFLSWQ